MLIDQQGGRSDWPVKYAKLKAQQHKTGLTLLLLGVLGGLNVSVVSEALKSMSSLIEARV